MATKIRLARFGRKKKPFYRISVTDSRSPRDGRNVEYIGYFDPLAESENVNVKRDRVLHWLGEGAIPSTTVKKLLSAQGIMLEWDLRKNGKTDDIIKEELQKFEMLQEMKLKNKQQKLEEKKKAQAEKTAEEEAPAEAAAAVEAPVEAEPVAVEAPVEEEKAETEPASKEEPAQEAVAEEPVAEEKKEAEAE